MSTSMTTHDPSMPQDAHRPRTDEEHAYYGLNQRVYAVFAPFYDLVAAPIRNVRKRVAALAGIDSHSRVLDVATGTGSQAHAFAEKAGEVIGIDLSEAMLRIARSKTRTPRVSFRQGDATDLPFPDASFDVACISFALHEMPPSIRKRVLLEMVRVIKPKATIVIVDYGRPRGLWGRVVFDVVKLYERDQYVNFIRSDLHGLLRSAGIDIQAEHYALFGIVRIVVGSRLVNSSSGRTDKQA